MQPKEETSMKEDIVKYFKSHLCMLPTHYTATETNRMTLAFFCLSALSLLGELENTVNEQNRKDWIDWIYAQQILPTGDEPDKNKPYCGFRGSSWSGRVYDPHATTCEFQHYDSGHIANTYTALLNLLILGDDLSRVNKKAILTTMKLLQQEDGSIAPVYESYERDVRFIYCASSICYILNDWSGIDVDKTVEHIRTLQSYEYGLAQCPDQEAHGGSTFCGVAALSLMNKLDEGMSHKEQLIQWCLTRQLSGFQGRPNKLADVCYGFWIGASLDIIGSFDLVNHDELREFMFKCHTHTGGFGKDPDSYADLLHSYMAIAVLSLMKDENVQPLHSALNIPMSVYEHMKTNSIFWKE